MYVKYLYTNISSHVNNSKKYYMLTGLIPSIMTGLAKSFGFTFICSETMLWKVYEPRKCSFVYHLDLNIDKND